MRCYGEYVDSMLTVCWQYVDSMLTIGHWRFGTAHRLSRLQESRCQKKKWILARKLSSLATRNLRQIWKLALWPNVTIASLQCGLTRAWQQEAAHYGYAEFFSRQFEPLINIKGKGKASPLQTWTGPEGSRKLRLPDFKTIGTWRW